MDGGGRLDQPLTRSGLSGDGEAGTPEREPAHLHVGAPPRHRGRRTLRPFWSTAYRRTARRWIARLGRLPLPPGIGIAGSILLLAGALGYGVVKGQHVPDVIDWFKDTRDAAANSLGLRIVAVSLTGSKEVSREEILTTAGVTGRASLLFLDADAARAKLMSNPWIGDAAVLKLYPDRLQITVTERQAFALWQKDGRVSVIAADGTVLEPFVEGRYIGLPVVIGKGAESAAKDFLAIVDRYPDIRPMVRASILVAERRWTLRLVNGIDVRLPETGVDAALDRLVGLDRDKKLMTRDVMMIDLRLPDRVTVRLSDAAAQARNEVLSAGKKKKKGGDA
jgi:cell division protein FtsQ